MSEKLSRLLEVKRQREEVAKMIELFKTKNKENGGRYSLKEKHTTRARHFKIIQVKKDQIRSNQKEVYRKLHLPQTQTTLDSTKSTNVRPIRTFLLRYMRKSMYRCVMIALP